MKKNCDITVTFGSSVILYSISWMVVRMRHRKQATLGTVNCVPPARTVLTLIFPVFCFARYC